GISVYVLLHEFFTDDFKQELEWRLRFPENTRRKMTRLRKQMSTAAGRDLPLAEPEALQRVLFEELGIARPGDDACQTALADAALDASTDALTSAPRPAVFGRTLSDPLAVLAGDAHPVIKPLLEFRTLEASEPRFATTELYEKVRRGEAELPVRNLRLRMGQERRGGAED
ncbi:MAG: hypothetical protein AAGD86_13855, partial [Pseudomonadota bacterium]